MHPGRGWPFLVIEAGIAPENQLGPLRHFKPDLVILVQAAQLEEAPGTVRWLEGEAIRGLRTLTHSLPPVALVDYLQRSLSCEVALVGIQPAAAAMGAPLSEGFVLRSWP